MDLGLVADKANTWIAKAMAVLIFPLLGVTLYGVIMRYWVRQPAVWGWQVLLLLFVPIAVLSGGYLLAAKAHIRVDLLYSRWSPRGQAICDMATFAAFMLFTAVLALVTIEMAWVSTKTGEIYHQYGFKGPIYPKKIALAIGVILLLLQGVVLFARNVRFVIGKKVQD